MNVPETIISDMFASCIALPAMASSVRTARIHTRDLTEKWHIAAMSDDVELIVSEMVTNAIKATNAIPSQASYPELYDRLEVVCLGLYLMSDELLIEVWDPAQEPPEQREVTPYDEGGRGLWMVESLSEAWGTRWPHTGGKIVWTRLRVAGCARA